ncbi:MAG TPA: hypothetical protein VGM23_02490, partial [Armatimonadota bacterium]
WLQTGLGLLWLSILFQVHLLISTPPATMHAANGQPGAPVVLPLYGVLIGTIILLIAHLFVVLEPIAFADRSIRLWLSLAFASLGLLAILPLLVKLATGSTGQPVLFAGYLLLLAGVIVLYIVALRKHLRWLLPLALLSLFVLAALSGS